MKAAGPHAQPDGITANKPDLETPPRPRGTRTNWVHPRRLKPGGTTVDQAEGVAGCQATQRVAGDGVSRAMVRTWGK